MRILLKAWFKNIPVGLAAGRGGWRRCSSVTDFSRIGSLVAPRHSPRRARNPFPDLFLKRALKLFLAVAVLGSAPRARADLVDAIQAVVGEAVITYIQVNNLLLPNEDALEQQYQNHPEMLEKRRTELRSSIFETLIDEQLILHEFKSAGFKIPESIIEEYVQDRIREMPGASDRVQLTKKLERQGMTYEDFRKRLHDEFIIQQMRYKFVPDPIISPLRVENYYVAHKDTYKVEDEVKLRIIVLNKQPDDTSGGVRKRMEEILSQIKDGASFAELAKSYSEGSQRSEGGATGWLELSKVNKALLDDVNKLKPGQNSGVIETRDACFLVLLEERHAAHIKPLSELRGDIEKTLIAQEKSRLWDKWMRRLKSKTFIQSF